MSFELEISYYPRPAADARLQAGGERQQQQQQPSPCPEGYVRIGVGGPWSLDSVYRLIEILHAQAVAHGCHRALIDSRGLASVPPEGPRRHPRAVVRFRPACRSGK